MRGYGPELKEPSQCVISSSDCVSRMQIDENREFAPFSNHSNTCKHTDHNAIILDLHIQNLKQPKVKIMTSNSYKKRNWQIKES